MPDYSQSSIVTSPFTATVNGWFLWTVNTGEGPEYLYINSNQVAWVAATGGSDNVGYTATLPITIGDEVTWSVGTGVFYPCKAEAQVSE